jgi:hypothetical protein
VGSSISSTEFSQTVLVQQFIQVWNPKGLGQTVGEVPEPRSGAREAQGWMQWLKAKQCIFGRDKLGRALSVKLSLGSYTRSCADEVDSGCQFSLIELEAAAPVDGGARGMAIYLQPERWPIG